MVLNLLLFVDQQKLVRVQSNLVLNLGLYDINCVGQLDINVDGLSLLIADDGFDDEFDDDDDGFDVENERTF